MTALANSPLFWTGLLAGLVCPAHQGRRDPAGREHPAGGVLELLPDRLASRAAPRLHDAAQGTLVAARCLTGVPSPPMR